MDWVFSLDRAAPGLPLAFAAGAVNSLSPCCLAMTPAFLAHLAGVETEAASSWTRMAHAILYVIGFSVVFIAFGAGLGLAGLALKDMRPLLFKVGGSVVIAFGLIQLGAIRLPWLQRSFEAPVPRRASPGLARSFIVGATYSIAWTPCIGPVLGAILTSVLVFGDLWQGLALLSAFALGMAVPHLLTALAFERMGPLRQAFQRHYVAVERLSGTVMVVMGVLIFTGALLQIFRYFQAFNVVL
jgi:cytochrome c-type biogenesis protein